MTTEVLSIPQVTRLKQLGFDFSCASCYYYTTWPNNNYKVSFKDEKFDSTQDIPTLTLNDIFKVLPKSIWVPQLQNNAQLRIITQNNMYSIAYVFGDNCFNAENNVDLFFAAYKMLIWCLENDIIKTNAI